MIVAIQYDDFVCYKTELTDEDSRVRIHFHTPGGIRDPFLRQLCIESAELDTIFDADEINAAERLECDKTF